MRCKRLDDAEFYDDAWFDNQVRDKAVIDAANSAMVERETHGLFIFIGDTLISRRSIQKGEQN